MQTYFDTHAHVGFAAFASDYKEVIDRALRAGVGLINVGTQKDTSARAVEVANEYEEDPVFAAVGLHPIHTGKSHHDEEELGGGEAAKTFTSRGEEFDYEYYKKLARDPKVVAIGECGLDYYRFEQIANREAQIEKQKAAFIKQIELSAEIKKPLMIHCRSAFTDLIDVLAACRASLLPNPGVVHFFTGAKDDAKKLLDLGFSFTFGGVVTFARGYDGVIKMTPTNRILSETDSPYVAPVPYRGKRNEPMYVIEVVKKLAELKNVSAEEIKNRIWENARRIFNFDKSH